MGIPAWFTCVVLLAGCAGGPRRIDADHVPTVVRVRAAGGAPLAGARVRLTDERNDLRTAWPWMGKTRVAPWEATAVTDEAGIARLVAGAGDADVRVDHPGYVPSTEGGIDRADLSWSVVLAPAAAIEGRVLDTATGLPVHGVRVTCSPSEWEPWRFRDLSDFGETTTAADGAFRIDTAAPDDAVILRTDAPGYARAHIDVKTPPARNALHVEIGLDPPAALAGVCRDRSGRPRPGVKVFAVARDPARVRAQAAAYPWPFWGPSDADAEVETGADGAFRIEGLSANTPHVVYALEIEKSESGDSKRVHSAMRPGVRPAAEPRVDLVLDPFPRAFVRVLNPAGAPRADTELHTSIDGHGTYMTHTDADGWAQVAPELGGLRRGPVTVRVGAIEFLPAEVVFDLTDGSDARAEVTLAGR